MNEQLQSKLVEILSGIQSATKAAGDFAMEQLPDIAQSYVVYGRASLTAAFVLTVLVTVCFVFVALKYGYLSKDVVQSPHYNSGSWTDARTIAAIGGTILSLTMTLPISRQIGPLFLVWLAPKVWLLKELAGLIK